MSGCLAFLKKGTGEKRKKERKALEEMDGRMGTEKPCSLDEGFPDWMKCYIPKCKMLFLAKF